MREIEEIKKAKNAIVTCAPQYSSISLRSGKALEEVEKPLPTMLYLYYFEGADAAQNHFERIKRTASEDATWINEYRKEQYEKDHALQTLGYFTDEYKRVLKYVQSVASRESVSHLCEILFFEGSTPTTSLGNPLLEWNSGKKYGLIEHLSKHEDGEWDGSWASYATFREFPTYPELEEIFQERDFRKPGEWIEADARVGVKVLETFEVGK